ncbi:MAG: VanZ family protein [Geminicoccaceae bacterium]
MPWIVALVLVFAGCAAPNLRLPVSGMDAWLHGGGFAGLSLVIFWSLGGDNWRRPVVLLTLFAIAAELVQLSVPGRSPSLDDVCANLTGVVLGAALALSLRSLARVRTPSVPAASFRSPS